MNRVAVAYAMMALVGCGAAVAAPEAVRVSRGSGVRAPHERTIALASQTAIAKGAASSNRVAKESVQQRSDGKAEAGRGAEGEPVRIAVRPPSPGRVGALAVPSAMPGVERRATSPRRVKIANISAAVPSRTASTAIATDVLYRASSVTRQIVRPSGGTKFGAMARDAQDMGVWLQFMADGFEGVFPGYWYREGVPTWGRTSYRRSLGSYSAWCAGSHYSPDGPYVNNMDAWMIDGPFDMRTVRLVEVYFDYWVGTEPYYDTMFVGVSTDGINFHGSAYSGTSGGWLLNERLLFDEVAGYPSVYIAVQFHSDPIVCNYPGAYVDNIEMVGYLPIPASTDLAVGQGHVVDPLMQVVGFAISNAGPVAVLADTYAVDVYVDGGFDSSARNTAPLPIGTTAAWDWPLGYFYAPGPHLVRVEVVPDAADPDNANNAIEFIINVPPPPPADLAPMNVAIVNSLLGEFDFDVYNYGPGPALPSSYLVSVYVDGLYDSAAWNANILPTGANSVWQWTLAYYYLPGAHNVVIDVQSDAPDPVPANNAIAFTLNVPFGQIVTDLRVYNPQITDPANDIFTFLIRNYGPGECRPGDYFIRILVDGWLDSTDYNHSSLPVGWEAKWTWQLAYLYAPGLHVITVEIVVNGADPSLGNNKVEFSHTILGPAFQIVPAGVVTGVLNVSMSDRFDSIGGAPPGTWRVPAGALPRGLALAGDGIISGTPRQAGVFPFTIEARDAAGAVAFANASVIILSAMPAVPTVLIRALPKAFVDVPYAAQLAATGGVPPYAWAALDPLPAGLSLSAAGVVSGTPGESGMFSFRVRARDATAADAVALVSLEIAPRDRYLNGSIGRCRITIPWKTHDKGDPSSDRIRLSATFDLPDRLVIDQYAKLVVFVGDYPISFNRPTTYKTRSVATFNASKTGAFKGMATIRKQGKNKVQVTLNVSKMPMADVLAPFGIGRTGAASAIVPIRFQVNDCATDARNVLLYYKLTGTTGVLKN